MRTITLEEHISTESFLKATSANQPPSGPMAEYMARIRPLLLDVDAGRIAAMDAGGVDVQVLSLAAGGLNNMDSGQALELAAEANDKMAGAMRAHPKRFSAFSAIAAQEPEKAAQELERRVRDDNFAGGMVDGTVSGEFLDKPRFLPIFEAAAALDVPIYLHPAPPPRPIMEAYFADLEPPVNFLMSTAAWGWHVETGMHSLRLMMSGLFDRLPNLKIIIGHMGEDLPFSIVRADNVLSRAHRGLKRTLQEYFRDNFWITTSGYFTLPPLMCAREVLPAGHILFSIDYPFSTIPDGMDLLKRADSKLSGQDLAQLAGGSASELLKLD